MKIVDKTLYYKETGELRWTDRVRATLQFGSGWFREIEAQKALIPVLGKVLDRNFTLLVNLTPPDLGATIPFILVGPTGVYVMTVTAMVGEFRAKGEQWGSVSGDVYKPLKPNLLTRTERMARAIQLYLQRQGYTDLPNVEAVLLCADPTTNVDSMRPIIRVIMRDALERFGTTIAQGRVVMNPESVFAIVNRLQNPPPPPKAAETPETSPDTSTAQAAAPAATAATLLSIAGATAAGAAVPPTQAVAPTSATTPPANADASAFPASGMPGYEAEAGATPASSEASLLPDQAAVPETGLPEDAQVRPSRRLTRRQILILVAMFVIWVILLAAFAFIVIRDLYPQLLVLK